MKAPAKLAPEAVRGFNMAYELAYLNVIAQALELGGFPPADALKRAREIRGEK